jgi:heat shock protein HtpX
MTMVDLTGSEDFIACQARNRRISAAIVFLFLLVFVLVGLSVDYLYFAAFTPEGPSIPAATLIALGTSVCLTYTAYRHGSGLILNAVGAEKLDREIPEHRELHNVVTEMALASGCPMPKVYVTYDPAPNALSTGKDQGSAAICVTTGLLMLLSREETQGVVAHEMAHIKNNDIRVMVLISVLLGGVVLLSDCAQRSVFSSRQGRRITGGNWLLVVPALLLIMFSPLISRLLAMAVSREREYLADASAVEFTRNPLSLAKALEKIRDAGIPFQKATRGTAHLFFSNPLCRRLDNRDGRLADLLSTHPPINRRILRLRQMAGLPQYQLSTV